MKDLIFENNLDILFIAEADIRFGDDYGSLSVNGFDTIFSQTLNSRGKARLICFKRCELDTFPLGSEFDIIIGVKMSNGVIIGIYRAFKCYESESEQNNFERLLDGLNFLNFNEDVTIVGDFNIDISRPKSRFSNNLFEWTDTKGLKISDVGVSRSRCVGDCLQESTIDFVLSNNNKF